MSGWERVTARWPEARTGALDRYVAELARWNKAVRLVGPRDEAGIRDQVVDALLPYGVEPATFPLLDIGSGAGLPAVPLALLHPGEPVLCVEPLAKRAAFLRHVARVLELDRLEVAQARIEEVASQRPGTAAHFACVTARAVTDVAQLLAWARPYLAPGGRVVLGRGGEEAPEAGGWRLVRRETYEGLPAMGARSVVTYQRIPETE